MCIYSISGRPSKQRATTIVQPPVSHAVSAVVSEKAPPLQDQLSADTPDTLPLVISADPSLPTVTKDQSGNRILETVMTPDGPVTIHRTFTPTGQLSKEVALLHGKAVPVPSQMKR